MTTQLQRNQPASVAAVVALGFGAIVFDGYDLIVYGSAVPALLGYEPWSLSAQQVGAIGSYTLLGMLIGAIAAGPLTDLLGRRRMFIGALTWFSLAMVLVSAAPTAELFGVGRFLAGLGFGGIPPIAIALVVEAAPTARRNLANAVMLCGFPAGGVLAAILGIALLEPLGFRALFAFGAIPLVTLVPLALALLPETSHYSTSRSGTSPAHRARELLTLFKGRAAIATLLFAIANFCGFLLVFGLNTWLPQLMREAGYDLGSSLAFLLVLNAGAIIGGLWGSKLADRHGSRWVATTLFALATASLALLAVPMPITVLYTVVFLAGAATIGTQIVVYGYVATHYPESRRATALGVSSGIGRLGGAAGPLLGGLIIGAGLGLNWSAGTFAAVAALGALAAALAGPAIRKTETVLANSQSPPARTDEHSAPDTAATRVSSRDRVL